MNEKKKNLKDSKGAKSSFKQAKSNAADNKEEFVIPFEAACSPEYVEGCILREDEEDKEY